MIWYDVELQTTKKKDESDAQTGINIAVISDRKTGWEYKCISLK